MMSSRVLVAILILMQSAPGQMKPDRKELEKIKNPLARDPAAIEKGREEYLSRCGLCHGTDAKGTGRGPNLTSGRWIHGGLDAEVFNSIKKGIPGTPMLPFELPDTEIWQLVAFIRSQGVRGDQPPVAGDPEAGRQLFFGKARCSSCHMIRGEGSPFGPELSNIGAERSAVSIRKSIVEPDAEIAPEFPGVRLRLKAGEEIEGLIRQEDEFSLQIMDRSGRFRFLEKTALSDLTRLEKKSFMPGAIARELSASELQNILAFLDRQRRVDEARSQ